MDLDRDVDPDLDPDMEYLFASFRDTRRIQHTAQEASPDQVSSQNGVHISSRELGFTTWAPSAPRVLHAIFLKGNVYTTWEDNLLWAGLPGGMEYRNDPK